MKELRDNYHANNIINDDDNSDDDEYIVIYRVCLCEP